VPEIGGYEVLKSRGSNERLIEEVKLLFVREVRVR
jgi:hypothetical protein